MDKSIALQHIQLIKVDPRANANKFWGAWLMPDGNLYVEYGRVNYSPRPHLYNYGSVAVAKHKLDTLVQEKLIKGYQEAAVESDPIETLNWSPFAERASHLKEKLRSIEQLGETIAQHCSIRFDAIRGVFCTALGTISSTTVEKANAALNRVESKLNTPEFEQAVGEYLAIIPLPVGMKLNAHHLLGSDRKINTQYRCLRQLKQGLSLIVQLRQELLEQAKDSTMSANSERAWWIAWGIVEETSSTSNLPTEDIRSEYVNWKSL